MLTRERLAQARLDVTTDALADLNFRLSGNTTPVPSQSALPAGALFASSSADTSSAESAETVAATSGPSIAINAQTLTFEDFDTDANGGGPVLTEYANLTWSNAVVIAPADFPYTNAFPNGLTSGTNLVANKFAANAVEITSSSDFNFVSANFISAARDGMTITMEFFDDGVSVGAAGFNIDTFGPVNTPFVAVNSIDRIVITASGGTLNSNYDPALNNTFFGIDDLVVETTGEIRGQLFDDVNGNGVREGTEARLEGRTVYIDANGNGLLDEGEQTAITASNGIYRFQDLLPDTYIIRQILPESHETTSPTPTFFSHYLQESGNDLNGPSHEWSTIVGVGTAVTLGDDSSALVTLPFTFEFWGQEETQVYISSNGFLTFDGADTTDVTNTDLPNAALGEPNGMIAPFWDDLNPAAGGSIHHYYDAENARFIVQYTQVPLYFGFDTVTFQVILYQDGKIEYQYRGMQDQGGSATVGIESEDNQSAEVFSFDTPSLSSQFAITYTPMYTVNNNGIGVGVEAGELITGVDFGSRDVSATTGLISGKLYHDSNQNGLFNPNLDFGLEGWFIYADETGNGAYTMGEAYAFTDANGDYTLSGIHRGDVDVFITIPTPTWEGWFETTPGVLGLPGEGVASQSSAHQIAVVPGAESTGNDFGIGSNATSGDDTITGTVDADVIDGLDGDDYIVAFDGDDILYGNKGNDYLEGGFNRDTLYGGRNDDVLDGKSSDDKLYGEHGNDTLIGNSGADLLDGGDQLDTASYNGSFDEIYVALDFFGHGGEAEGDQLIDIENLFGSEASDLLIGNDRINDVNGDEGDDILFGLAGADELRGYYGNDILFGGTGNDLLYGGKDNDTLTGGRNADIFMFYTGDGDNVITDFSIGQNDTIWINESYTFDDVVINEDSSGNAVISWGSLVTVTLLGHSAASVQESWFTFADYVSGAGSVAPEFSSPPDAPSESTPEAPASTPGVAFTTDEITLNFDDIDLNGLSLVEMTAGYMDLTWNNVIVFDSTHTNFDGQGYEVAATSLNNGVLNGFGDPMSFTGTTDFDLSSMYLTSGIASTNLVTITGWDDGVETYSKTVTVSDQSPTLVQLDFLSIDEVRMSSSTTDAFAIDDIVFNGTGEIRGQLFDDVNGNGIREATETRLEGRTVYIDANDNGILDDGEISDVTASNGIYRLQDLTAGTYTIRQVLPDFHEQTSPAPAGFNGYIVRDSSELFGPTHSWSTIAGIGTELTLGDDDSASVSLPFEFLFYDEVQTSIHISSNGYLTFGGSGANIYENVTLPDGTANSPDGIIAPFWDDLNPLNGGSIHYYADMDTGRFIVQYTQVPRFGSSELVTFQVILHSDGQIEYQYRGMQSDGSSATVGIEKNDNSEAELYSFNTGSLSSQFAITFTPDYDVDASARTVTVGGGELVQNEDFGSRSNAATTGGISGTVFHDTNGNLIFNPNIEFLLEGWLVYIDENTNGSYDLGEAYDVSDANGDYLISGLAAGDYNVSVEYPPQTWENWNHVPPISVNVQPGLTVSGNDIAAVNQASYYDDTIHGANQDDVIDALEGDDSILGHGGNDVLFGNKGDDFLAGSFGNDTLYGGRNEDELYGGAEDDELYGEHGNDLLIGGPGADLLDGGDQIDTASYLASSVAVFIALDAVGRGGDAEGDTFINVENLTGSAYSDYLIGNDRINTLNGNDGDDLIIGLGGADILIGGAGDDYLQGGIGNDLLDGGENDDKLLGGTNADTFFFIGTTGHDIILDYAKSQNDIISLAEVTAFNDLIIVDNADGDAVVSWDFDLQTHSVTLVGHAAADVQANWFQFSTGPLSTSSDPLSGTFETRADDFLADEYIAHTNSFGWQDGEWQMV
ncbi:MAG: hypothetical protein CMK07_04060 [Ponticaulis sp.]|nr:hypothetical protein [Ponticaulis sp.]